MKHTVKNFVVIAYICGFIVTISDGQGSSSVLTEVNATISTPIISENATNARLVADLTECPEKKIVYWDEHDDPRWFCGCSETTLYYPPSNSCEEIYRQGPCKEGEYIILPKNERFGACEKNPCVESRVVPLNGTCFRLNDECGVLKAWELYVGMKKPQCISMLKKVKFVRIPKKCPEGRVKDKFGICREAL